MSTEHKIEPTETPQHSQTELHSSDGLTAGEILRQRREKLGLSQKDIAQKLRLKVSVIESVESHEFGSHQVATFIRGYFRSYAKVVGISEKEILKVLELSGEGQHQHKEHMMQSFSHQTKKQKHDSHIMRITWGVLVVIIGISSIWWWQNHQQDTLSASSIKQDQAVAANSVLDQNQQENNSDDLDLSMSSDDISSDESQDSDVVAQDAQESNTSSSEVAVALDAQTPQSQEEAKIEALSQSETSNKPLVMNFKNDCWIQVKDSQNKILATGMKKAGESVTLTGNTPYSIILGAPEGVSITLADEPVDLSRYTAGKAARLTLP
ncbi:cytoskeleton protein RodZ [Vibrio hibernica]|uniref:cytoskeleton protein RodZ n=1 Tax=Vibrio hibernica TaxID=2587465 RepID=UPI001882CFEF|nr:cytoskeleton protein RodZ [Vibrio hibernica]